MTIKIRFTQNSFTEVEMSQSLSATYKCPHTHTHTDSTWLWLCLRYIKGISSINRTFHSSFACFFSSIFAGWELRCCERVCVLYKD